MKRLNTFRHKIRTLYIYHGKVTFFFLFNMTFNCIGCRLVRTNHQRDHGCRQTVTDKNLNLFQNQFLQHTMTETSKDPSWNHTGLKFIYFTEYLVSPYLTQKTYY